MMVGVCRSDMV